MRFPRISLWLLAAAVVPFVSFAGYWMAKTADGRVLFSRVFLLWFVALALLALLRRPPIELLCRLLLAPGSAFDLAAFRIVLSATTLLSVHVGQIGEMAALSPEMIVSPPGLAWLAPLLPKLAPFAVMGAIALQATSVASLIGLFPRISLTLMALLGTWIFGFPNFYGKVFHLHQCLVWFAIVLAASPCADRLSVHALRGAGPRFHARYGLPMKTVWLLLGMIYGFPGFWKMYFVGFDWIFGDHLALRMYRQWFWLGLGHVPGFRIDLHPALFALSAAAVLVLELGFFPAMFSRKWRGWFAAGAFVFHAVNQTYILYQFFQLRACLAALVPWGRLVGEGAPPGNGAAEGEALEEGRRWLRGHWPGPAIYAIVFALVFLTGVTDTISWPFSAYPHFAQRFEAHLLTPRIYAFDGEGKPLDVRPAMLRLARVIDPVRMVNRIEFRLLAPDHAVSVEELRSLAIELPRLDPLLGRAARFQLFEETRSTIPEEWPRNPLSRRLRLTLKRENGLAWVEEQ